jgi:hypothetical protein
MESRFKVVYFFYTSCITRNLYYNAYMLTPYIVYLLSANHFLFGVSRQCNI